MVQGGNDWTTVDPCSTQLHEHRTRLSSVGDHIKALREGRGGNFFLQSAIAKQLLPKELLPASLATFTLGLQYADIIERDDSHYMESFTSCEYYEAVSDIPTPSYSLGYYQCLALVSARSTAWAVYNHLRFEIVLLNEVQIQAVKMLNRVLSCSWLHFYGNMGHFPNQKFVQYWEKHVYFDFVCLKASTN